MKNRGLYITLCVLTVVLLVLPTAQQHLHLFKLKPLKGVNNATERPKLSVKEFLDGTYQANENQYLAENIGFREPLIRYYNQLMWSLFHKTYCQDVVVGKDKWLYGNRSVNDYFRQTPYLYADNDEELVKNFEKSIARVKKVQQILNERGTKLFVLICPSKDEICPEHLPTGRSFVMYERLRAVEYFPKAFAENGINFIDMNAWFKQLKDKVDYPLFPKTGTHWSNLACMHACDSLIRYMERLTGMNMPNISVGPMYSSETRKPDGDLEGIMNLIWEIKPNQNYYADVTVIPDSTAQRLNLITIGDSFFWNIAYTMPMDELFESHPYWYYFSTVYYDPKHKNVKQLDLMTELDHADVVMILLTNNHLYDIFGGFFNKVLTCFSDPDPDTLNNILEDIMKKMDANSDWLAKIKEKAERKGISLEEMKRADAIYLFRQNPDKYISKYIQEKTD